MSFRIKFATTVLACAFLGGASSASAQQKPQWMPGQVGLNAGILPSPGFTYVNLDINYNAGSFNDRNGNAVRISGTYNVWAIENLFYYIPDTKFLGGNLGFMIMYPTPANGSLVADFERFPNLGVTGGGYGIADLWVQPFTVGWHLKRADIQVGDAFMIPTGRYTPRASNNIGSGYFGNHLVTGTTFYITKNKGTSANLFTDWEVHGQRQGANNTYKTPGQAFTDEWGVGQILPLKKDFSKLLQLGVIGYDQWQVTANGGTIPIGPIVGPAYVLPFYSVHAVGGQVTYIQPAKHLSFFFKYEHEYKSYSHTLKETPSCSAARGPWQFQKQPHQSRREDQVSNEGAGREKYEMLKRAEKPRTGDQISLPLGYVYWGLQLPNYLGIGPAEHGFGSKISYAWLI